MWNHRHLHSIKKTIQISPISRFFSVTTALDFSQCKREKPVACCVEITEADAAALTCQPEYGEARPRVLRPRRAPRLDATPAGPSSSGGSTPPATHAAAGRRLPCISPRLDLRRRRRSWRHPRRTTSPSGRPAAATGSATSIPSLLFVFVVWSLCFGCGTHKNENTFSPVESGACLLDFCWRTFVLSWLGVCAVIMGLYCFHVPDLRILESDSCFFSRTVRPRNCAGHVYMSNQ